MDQSIRYSRRKLLNSIGLGGVGFATASWAWPAAAGQSNPLTNVVTTVVTPLRLSGYADWAAAVGTVFSVQGESGSFNVKLASVLDLPAPGIRPAELRPSAFALVFEGKASAGALFPAGNRTYLFQQAPNGGQIQLFVGAKYFNGTAPRLLAVMN
jgi:hypothetical protein